VGDGKVEGVVDREGLADTWKKGVHMFGEG
jgi:hypothetical protein